MNEDLGLQHKRIKHREFVKLEKCLAEESASYHGRKRSEESPRI
jgi:hypothetical protein